MSLECNYNEVILNLALKYKNELVIIGIGPLTPLAEALKQDHSDSLCQIKSIYLQGIIKIDQDGQIEPDFKNSYNFREDEEAASLVFNKLRNKVNFNLLGRFAAYQVGITQDDFVSFYRKGVPSIEETAKK